MKRAGQNSCYSYIDWITNHLNGTINTTFIQMYSY
jgi:hypothetical protein